MPQQFCQDHYTSDLHSVADCSACLRLQKQQANIEQNKVLGLLCACNRVRVPYGPPPGTTFTNDDNTLHGYDYCETDYYP